MGGDKRKMEESQAMNPLDSKRYSKAGEDELFLKTANQGINSEVVRKVS